MQIDEISYLDQLYGEAVDHGDQKARDRFMELVWKLWPEITAAFDEHKHSL